MNQLMVEDLPYWVKLVAALGPTTAALVAVLIASVIQYRTWRTAKEKLRLDLFERRFKVYDEIISLLQKYFRNSRVDLGDAALRDFDLGTRGYEFLFDAQLNQYIASIRSIIVDALNDQDLISDFDLPERRQSVERLARRRQELREIQPQITIEFSRFLSFERIKT